MTLTIAVAKPAWATTLEEDRTEFTADPLELAVAAKAKRDGNGWSMAYYEDKLTQEDINTARQIRSYYAKKFTWSALKRDLSPYRSAVIRLLAVKGKWNLTDQDQGLFYKLPYFYDEDKFYDSLKKEYDTSQSQHPVKFDRGSADLQLTSIGSTIRWQGKNKFKQYWFADADRKLLALKVSSNTPFMDLFEEKLSEPVCIKAATSVDKLQEMFYYNISSNFKFIKE